ncbi:MAG TPA: RNA-binding S4 domain-containing protein [Burkholderiaceae bacterium]
MTEISGKTATTNAKTTTTNAPTAERVRLDKWLWAARFFKTRSLAAEEIARGRVSVNDQVAKASRELRCGDRIDLRLPAQQGALVRSVVVTALSPQRGSATVAQGLYVETAESLARRAHWAERRREQAEPAMAIEHGRPTKRDRRQLADWNRWSASVDPE